MPSTYQALKYSPPSPSGTWAILDHDGARRPMDRYLSSLGGGEPGIGVIVSPPFRVATDTITFTICGHDGPKGGQGKNFIALVDVKSTKVLHQTNAPGSDRMQTRSWDVAKLRGRDVQIEVHDGISATAYAWLGIGRIDAGDALRVDFRNGMPEGWSAQTQPADFHPEIVPGGIPFLRYPAVYTMVPASGELVLPCGFPAERLFFLGCTIAPGRPLEQYGTIEIVYRSPSPRPLPAGEGTGEGGTPERYPLMCGFTLDLTGKLLSESKAMYLHASGDPFQHYLVLAPRGDVIEKIVLRRNPQQESIPRITAVTYLTSAASDHLSPLPNRTQSAEEAAWIQSHALTATSPDMTQITAEIRRANHL